MKKNRKKRKYLFSSASRTDTIYIGIIGDYSQKQVNEILDELGAYIKNYKFEWVHAKITIMDWDLLNSVLGYFCDHNLDFLFIDENVEYCDGYWQDVLKNVQYNYPCDIYYVKKVSDV